MLLTILHAFIQRIIVNIVSIVPCVLLALALFEGWRTTPCNSQVLGCCWIVTGWTLLRWMSERLSYIRDIIGSRVESKALSLTADKLVTALPHHIYITFPVLSGPQLSIVAVGWVRSGIKIAMISNSFYFSIYFVIPWRCNVSGSGSISGKIIM